MLKNLSSPHPTSPSSLENNNDKSPRPTDGEIDDVVLPGLTSLPAAPSTTDKNLDLEKLVKESSGGQMGLISAQSNCDSTSKIAIDNDLEKGEQATAKKHWWSPLPQGITGSRKNTFPSFCKEVLLSSWVNGLLVFIPAGIAVHFAPVNPAVVFVMNFLAIVPLAGVNHPLGAVPPLPYNIEPDFSLVARTRHRGDLEKDRTNRWGVVERYIRYVYLLRHLMKATPWN